MRWTLRDRGSRKIIVEQLGSRMAYQGSYLWTLRQKVGTELVLLPGASILVENERGEILLTKRSDSDTWCMPGGGAEVGTSFVTVALMELREEVGIIATPEELVPFACISDPAIHVLTYPSGDQTHCFAMFFALRRNDDRVTAGDEVREVRFFAADDLPPNTLRPSSVAVELYRKYRATGLFQAS